MYTTTCLRALLLGAVSLLGRCGLTYLGDYLRSEGECEMQPEFKPTFSKSKARALTTKVCVYIYNCLCV